MGRFCAGKLLIILLLALLLSSCMWGNFPSPPSLPSPTPPPPPEKTRVELPSLSGVVRKVLPSVVYISAIAVEKSFIFEVEEPRTGSGVILHPEGYILTNDHVIKDARSIDVYLTDGRSFKAFIVGRDPLTDLAVIKIDGDGPFPYSSFAEPGELEVGDWVIAIGNALGLKGGPTITVGIVSNLGRSFSFGGRTYYDVIQTDAAINPGNSGGPLVNLEGEVVGINTFVISGAENMGFAINVSTAKPVYEALVKPPYRVRRAWLGVSLETLTPSLARSLGIGVERGVLVASVVKDSPAWKAGIREGDVILEFKGEKVYEATQLIKLIWKCKVGERVEIVFWHEGNVEKAYATLIERPS